MVSYDRAVAIRTILKVFNDEGNKAAFERMLYDKAAEDIESFYHTFVVPVMPKDIKLEVEGVLGIADIRSIFGDAVTPLVLQAEQTPTIEADTTLVQLPEVHSAQVIVSLPNLTAVSL